MMSIKKRNAMEEAVIRDILDNLPLPDTVKEYRLSLRPDSVGEPGVYILFVLDDRLDDKAFLSEASKIRQAANDGILNSEETDRYPYPTFRDAEEQNEIDHLNPGRNF